MTNGEATTTTCDFMLEEAVLLRRPGGPAVTRELFGHILEVASLRNVTLQAMPVDSEHHACLEGPVRLLETPEGHTFAYSEGQENGRLLAGVKEVARIHRRYARLRSQALSPKESMGLLERRREEL
ncbi:hypothetical protein FNQ90_03410 [Streptomyces alkaliphilus]|uniref:DUF5753 domain-containing protein n=1 Tax=Streptomyces alkaliphilus TaxID=1472722 RepID=A0A7W3TAB3_9ACTN|nr:DUF5753 domain-containing protein [Streptomyces alkaliphilus]MBB0243183.1 hypothetical protein [Streptomyces alkaliphilus]